MFYQISEDLYLRKIALTDAEVFFQLTDDNRLHLQQWLPWLHTTTCVEHTKQFISFCVESMEKNESLHTVIIFRGEIVGISGYNSINWSNRTASIGYWLAENAQGHGIMTKVVQALTDYAIFHVNLNKVEIRAATRNTKSRSIPKRLGFKEEGTLRQAEWLYDHFVDHVVYGVLATEWQKSVHSNSKAFA